MNRVIIIGCGGHARSVADALITNDPNIHITFIDKNAHLNETILSFPVQTDMPLVVDAYHVALGDNASRKRWTASRPDQPISVISKGAVVSTFANIEKGTFIGQNSYVGPLTNIGEGNIINTAAIVEHEVTIGCFCHVAPNSTICGRSHIGNNVFLGASSTVIDGISICDDVIIGANSTVTSDIPDSGTYVGSPIRKVK